MDNDNFNYDTEDPDEVDDEVIEESNVDKARKKLDCTEPANSYQRYFLYSKGDQKAKCRVCGKSISRKFSSYFLNFKPNFILSLYIMQSIISRNHFQLLSDK